MNRRIGSVLAIVPVTLVLSGVLIGAASAHQPASRQLSSSAVASTTITIHSYTFSVPSSVPAGASITVVNQDTVDHTVTASGGAFNATVPASSSATFTAPSQAGSYPFICLIHPDMHGSLTVAAVTPPGGNQPPETPPTGPVAAGDGGSVTGHSAALEAVGAIALVAALGVVVMWRRSSS